MSTYDDWKLATPPEYERDGAPAAGQPEEIPQEAMKRDEGVLRHVEPMQTPTPGSFAGLENREEVIAKPRVVPPEEDITW